MSDEQPTPPAPPEASSLRLVFSLGLTGLLSGLVLVGVFLLTAPRIERNRAEALTAAVYRVLPGTSRVSAFVVEEGVPTAYEGPEGSVPQGEALFAGHDENDALVGYAIPARGNGFQDTIQLIYGYDPGRRVIIGMAVLESRETPGLGDKIIHDPEFLANFAALVVEPEIIPVKKDQKTKDNEVDCITGATISSEAVVNILNNSTSRWLPVLEQLASREQAHAEVGGDDSPIVR